MTPGEPAGRRTSRRIGLFGGSFNPVHRAHLALARQALNELGLDELRWLPAGQPWQKPEGLAPAEHRLAMVRLAVADPVLGDPRHVVDDLELRRTGPSFTIDTVEALQQREPDARWVLLIGQDQHAGLTSWHRWRDLLDRVRLAVAARPGVGRPVDPDVAARGHDTISLPPDDVSSTAVRTAVAQGRPVSALVPAAVAGYIESHQLYRPGRG